MGLYSSEKRARLRDRRANFLHPLCRWDLRAFPAIASATAGYPFGGLPLPNATADAFQSVVGRRSFRLRDSGAVAPSAAAFRLSSDDHALPLAHRRLPAEDGAALEIWLPQVNQLSDEARTESASPKPGP